MTRARGKRSTGGYSVGPGTLVTLAYELFDAEGEAIEASPDDAPLELLFGYGEAPPAFERALDGAREGQATTVQLSPADAFGERDPQAIIEVDPAELPPGTEVGDEFEAEGPGGAPVPLKVVELTADIAVLDTNHPLAGQRVRFKLVVRAVRPATPERIAAATERLTRVDPGPTRALLPAERLLRRVRLDPPTGGPDPAPGSGRVNESEKP